MRRQRQGVEIITSDGVINALRLEGRSVAVVSVVRAWRVGRRWWRFEAPRTYYALQCEDGALREVYEELFEWVLSGVQD
jgi:hypothetical protein